MWEMLKGRRLVVAARLMLFAGAVAMLLQTAPALVAASGSADRSDPAAARPARLGYVPIATAPARTSPAATAPARAPAAASDTTATLSSIAVQRELQIAHWLRPGEFAWDDESAPAGPTIVVVNLRARVLSVYRAGVEIGRSSLIYGHGDHPTPTGTFPILAKRRDHRSSIYDAPMPHTLRLTGDGVSLHGSAELRDDLVSHGCVGLPLEFAALLFDAVRVGDRVVIWDGTRSA